MARDGAGNYNLPPGEPVVTETIISSTQHNTTMADLAAALTQSVSRDGQTTYTSNQSMGGFKHTQVADATARNQYATAAQVQDGNLTLINAVSGSNTITGTLSPAITTYPLGVFLTLIPFQANTGAVTLALNGLAAKPVVKFNGVPLVAGDLLANVPATLVYNGTNFYLENPQVVASDVARLSQANTFTSNNTFSAAGSSTAPTVRLSSSFPWFEKNNTNAPANARSWMNYVDSNGSWVLRADSDDHSSSNQAIAAFRNGNTVTQLNLNATSISLNGVATTDYARLSQTNQFTGASNRFGAVGVGYTTINPGTNLHPGYIAFYTEDNVRRGYIGFGDSSNRLFFFNEGGWVWNFGPSSPTVNGVQVTDASLFTTGTLANARVAQSNVTQHQASLAIGAGQVSSIIEPQTTSFAVPTSHAGRIVICDSASTILITVSSNCLGDGKAALYIRRNTGAVTFSASGVTIRSPGGGLSITTQHGKAALIQVSSTEFELAGNV